ncbi:MAG: SprB repeat-containing protein, partial [Crocinitomicaceae bacterium]|nr:SprB repeat-containing protein [Flavobacteriales bacterium]NQZ38044.1 SprB repeat-containing protein [Crocinitomicaceae bacterium]
MKNYLQVRFEVIALILFISLSNIGYSQYCDSITPTMNVDLSASPNVAWTSPLIARNGNCCGTTNPDRCLEFVITLHPNAIAVSFAIASGAVPPGALFYQIDCGPITPVGSPICLDGPGPHHLTFCKPGNNENTFSITSYSEPIIGADTTLNAGCQGFIYAQYYNEPSVSWTSIAPGSVGDYDSYLSCTSGCDTTMVNAPNSGAPAYVDYLVCGNDIGECNPSPICDTIRVNFVPPHQVDVTPLISTICPGDPPVLLTANVSGGTGPFTYLWSNGATTVSILETVGTHTVTVTDQGGCLVISNSAVINEYILPNVNAGLDQSVCDGVSVTLNGSGATSYVWDNGVTDGIGFVQAVGIVTYTVVGTDGNGCSNTDQVDVTVNPLPIVVAGADQTVCDGVAVTLNGSGATSYVWDNGITDGVSFIPAVGTITYSVIGTDGNGCSNTDQVNITVNPLPIVVAGIDQTVCDGASVTLNGSGATSYVWDNGITDGVSFIPAVGTITYSVIGTDANGCSNTDQVDVTVNPLPIVVAGADQTVCDGDSVTLNGSGAT